MLQPGFARAGLSEPLVPRYVAWLTSAPPLPRAVAWATVDSGTWNNKQQVRLLLLANGRAAAKIGFAMLARAREKTLKAKTNGIFHATCEKLFPMQTKNSLR